jgi:hypothetical protein
MIGNLIGLTDEHLSRAERYCNDYCIGFHDGDSRYKTRELRSSDSEGYKRGFAVGRAISTYSDQEERDAVRLEFQQPDSYNGVDFTPEERDRWRVLNEQVIGFGNKSWEVILLEAFRYLRMYAGAANQSEEELSAQRDVMRGIIRRFAAALPKSS